MRTATNKVKQYAMNLSPLEIQVEEATNMDTWGPHGTVMSGEERVVERETERAAPSQLYSN